MSTAPAGPAPTEPAEILTHATLGYRFAHLSTWAFGAVWFRESYSGREHLPKQGGVVVVSNHQSFYDIPVLSHAIPRHVSFVARDTLANFAPLAWLMRTCGAVLVKRGAPDRAALREMVTHLERGDCLAVFPEGTRTVDGRVSEFKAGALLAARMAKVPIVPCSIRGSFEALPKGALFPRPKKIRVQFGSPIDSSLPDALERAHAEDADLFSVFPEHVTVTWAERLAIPLLSFSVMVFLPVRLAHTRPEPAIAAANGQFLAFRPASYAAAGGHEAIKADLVEDLRLAQRVKAAGGKHRLADGTGWVRCRMYRDAREVFLGFAKNCYPAFGGRPGLFVATMSGIVTLYLAPWLTWTVDPWGAAVAIAMGLALRSLMGRSAPWKGRTYPSRAG